MIINKSLTLFSNHHTMCWALMSPHTLCTGIILNLYFYVVVLSFYIRCTYSLFTYIH